MSRDREPMPTYEAPTALTVHVDGCAVHGVTAAAVAGRWAQACGGLCAACKAVDAPLGPDLMRGREVACCACCGGPSAGGSLACRACSEAVPA